MFTAKVFGRELVFVDIGADTTLARELLWAKSEEINLAAAYHDLFGRLFGEKLFIDIDKDVRHALTLAYIKRHVGATQTYVRTYFDRELGPQGSIDGVGFFSDFVLHTLMHYMCKDELCADLSPEIARLITVLESDYSIIGLMFPIETATQRRRVAARERLVELFTRLVCHRLASKEPKADFLQQLLDTKLGERRNCTADEIEFLALRLMGVVFGAHTNTSMSVPAVLIDLIERPEHLHAVRTQMLEFAKGGEIGFEDLRKLTELHRCITETLRLKSNGIMWRKAVVDVQLGGHDIAAGSIIGASMGLINLDDGRYDEPDSYCPARYGAHTTDQFQSPQVVKTPLEYCAFGTGRNVCSGRQLAYTLLATIFTRLLLDFDWTLESRPKMWLNLFGPGVARPIGRIKLSYRRR